MKVKVKIRSGWSQHCKLFFLLLLLFLLSLSKAETGSLRNEMVRFWSPAVANAEAETVGIKATEAMIHH